MPTVKQFLGDDTVNQYLPKGPRRNETLWLVVILGFILILNGMVNKRPGR